MNNFEEIELRAKILLSTYKGMLGMISPDIRLISIDWGIEYFAIKAFFDRPVNETDMDMLKYISTEVVADFPDIKDVKEYAEFSLEPIEKIQGLKEMVFLRYGELKL